MFVSQASNTWDMFELRYTLGLQFTSGGRQRPPESPKTEPETTAFSQENGRLGPAETRLRLITVLTTALAIHRGANKLAVADTA